MTVQEISELSMESVYSKLSELIGKCSESVYSKLNELIGLSVISDPGLVRQELLKRGWIVNAEFYLEEKYHLHVMKGDTRGQLSCPDWVDVNVRTLLLALIKDGEK
jgi:hypothetical protein